MSGPMRIALFAADTGLGRSCLEVLLAGGNSVLLILPPEGWKRRLLRLLGHGRSGLEKMASRAGQPITHYPEDCERALQQFCPDAIAIVIFPKRVPERLLATARLGAVNLHPSLLPRHRGPLPLFWTYYHNDALTGLTVHQATELLDAGPIVLQESFPLARGCTNAQLMKDLSVRSGPLLVRAIAALEEGMPPQLQDECQATQAPMVRSCESYVRFGAWDVEQTWHFLHGLFPLYREPLKDVQGAPIVYAAVGQYRRGPAAAPGSVTPDGSGWLLHCRGGVIPLAKGRIAR